MNAYSALAGEPAAGGGDDEVLLLERDQRLVQVAALVGAGGASESSQNVRPDDRGLLDELALEGLERVEPRRQQRLDRVGQLGRARPRPPRAGAGRSPRRRTGCRPHARRCARAAPRRYRRRAAARVTSARVSSGVSGSRKIEVASRRPPPQPWRRSSSSSRARQSISSGPRTHLARCSIRSSMPWSAQWMSSNASTSGPRRARPSTALRDGGEEALAQRCGSSAAPAASSSGASMPSEPGDQRGVALRLAARVERPRAELADARRELLPCRFGRVARRGSRTPRARLRPAPSTRRPSRRGGSGPRANAGAGSRGGDVLGELVQQPRLADACLAEHRDEVGAALARRPGRRAIQAGRARRRGRRAALRVRGGALAGRATQAGGLPGGHRLGLALQVERRTRGSRSPARRAHGALAYGDVPGRPAACRRDATFTVSPITV